MNTEPLGKRYLEKLGIRDAVIMIAFQGNEAVTDDELEAAFRDRMQPRLLTEAAKYLRDTDDLQQHYPELRR